MQKSRDLTRSVAIHLLKSYNYWTRSKQSIQDHMAMTSTDKLQDKLFYASQIQSGSVATKCFEVLAMWTKHISCKNCSRSVVKRFYPHR